MRGLLTFAILNLGMSALAISAGDRVKAVRDTRLMSGTQTLAQIKKDTLLDVKAIDPRSKVWLQTEVTEGEKAIKGWIHIRDVVTISGSCAAGYEWKCSSYPVNHCQQTNCENVCTTQNQWKCETTSEWDPETNTWQNHESCWWEPVESCTQQCQQECWTEWMEACSCSKSSTDETASWAAPK